MKAKQENRLSEQKNFSSHYRIGWVKKRILVLVVWACVVGLVSCLTGVSAIYVVVGLWVAKSVLRMLFSVICRLLVFAVVVLLLFSLLMH